MSAADTPDYRISEWVNGVLEGLEKSGQVGEDILSGCGCRCAERGALIELAESVRESIPEGNPEMRLSEFKTVYSGSAVISGNAQEISLVFPECTCPLVSELATSHPFLCNCTVGFTNRVFRELFGKPVTVDLMRSILKGDSVCEQRIRIRWKGQSRGKY